MSDSFGAWADLPASDMRSMLIALIGCDFGTDPETKLDAIRGSRRAYADYVGDQSGITASDVVVDLGSGCGFGTYSLAKRAGFVHACDVSPAYLSFAQRECSDLPNVAFHRIESRDLSFLATNSVDVVCSLSVFIHLNLYDIYSYFKEFQRAVKPTGRVWIDFADSESLDLTAPNRNGQLFLAHAEEYAANPSGLPGYMCWHSSAAIAGIASHFGFECKTRTVGGEMLFIRRAKLIP
jgi:Methyltransferase domain